MASTLLSICGLTCGHAAEPETDPRIAQVESGLPAVQKDGLTLDLNLVEWMETLAIPGLVIAVIDDHRIVWAKGYGVMEAGAKDAAVGPQTLFQAASISKAVTAIAVMDQVERGTFALDAEVNRYLESWTLPANELQATEKVTIARLLAHTAGITAGGFAGYARGGALPGIVQILDGDAPVRVRRSATADWDI